MHVLEGGIDILQFYTVLDADRHRRLMRVAVAAQTVEQHGNPDKRDGIDADGHEGKFIARRMDRVAADDRRERGCAAWGMQAPEE